MNKTIAAIAALALAVATLVGVQVAQAPPAAAEVLTQFCNPSATGWSVKGRWADGSVLEARACLQIDTNTAYHRVRVEWRARRGGTALSGTDWDLDSYQSYVYVPSLDIRLGYRNNYTDIYNTSYLAIYSTWSCLNTTTTSLYYDGWGRDIRATPLGLPRSGYKDQTTNITNSPEIRC